MGVKKKVRWTKKKIVLLVVAAIILLSMISSCMKGKKEETTSTTAKKETESKEKDTDDYEEFKWPEYGLAKLIPTPKSNRGRIDYDSSDSLIVYVAETTREEYIEYVDACMKNGFDVDYNKVGDYHYEASNKDGYNLVVEYDESNVVLISMNAPDEEPSEEKNTPESEAAEDNTPEPEPKADESADASADDSGSSDDNSIDPEFKDALDSYEAFMDEYIAFMDKYENSDDTASLLVDYGNYMAKYSEMATKIDSMDKDNLTTAELNYYYEVTTRVSQKLIDAAQ